MHRQSSAERSGESLIAKAGARGKAMPTAMPSTARNSPLGRCHLIVNLEGFGRGDEERVRDLLGAGLPSFQARAKGAGTREMSERCLGLRMLAKEAGALFIVNGNIPAALELGADGIHLPSNGPSIEEARRQAPGLLVGMSCHDHGEVERAQGADWIFLSPVFSVPSKGARPLGVAGFADLAAHTRSPAYALGGVDASNAAACLDAGAAGIAAIRSLWGEGGEKLIGAVLSHERSRKAT